MRAGRHHLHGLLRTDDAGEALRSTGTGEEAEVDFRQAALGTGYGNAVVGAEGDFKTTAEGGAVDGRDHRLVGVFHHGLDLVQALRRGRRTAELGDVSTRNERSTGTDQHDRLDARIGPGGFEGVVETVAYLGAEGIHGWRIQRDDRDVAVVREVGDFVDLCH